MGCVFWDRAAGIFVDCTEGPKSLGINSTSTISKATLREASTRENKGPSLGKIQVKLPHQRRPYAVTFEDRSQEEIERQERCAGEDAWRMAKNTSKLKETVKAAFFSPTNALCLPAPSVTKLEEREFVVDSGASMHMLSRKDLNSAELHTVKVSESPTTVVTADGEVQTKEEPTVSVKELDLFVTRRSRTCPPKDQWSETTTHQRWQTNNVPIVVPGLSTGSSSSATPTSPTSLLQEAVSPTQHPASNQK